MPQDNIYNTQIRGPSDGRRLTEALNFFKMLFYREFDSSSYSIRTQSDRVTLRCDGQTNLGKDASIFPDAYAVTRRCVKKRRLRNSKGKKRRKYA